MKKKVTSIISAAACAAAVLGTVPFAASADELVYGTMNIPYADFYANEGIGYEVDAVSSATTDKWCNTAEGGTAQGTFNEGNGDGTGRILGVVYPVAISQGDLDALGDNNYNFAVLDSAPTAYKTVTVENGSASFSAVVDEDGVENNTTTVTIETTSVWGDYCVTIDDLVFERGAAASSIGKLYGCIVTDTNGNNYAMRHLENIWKNELGINVLETATDMHGAPMSYANFVGLNGATIDKVTYITEKGYYIYDVDPDGYLAKKASGTVEIANVDVSAGSTTITSTLPSDYEATYTFDGLDASVRRGNLTFTNALPGSYSVTVSDANGIYESLTYTFELTSDSMPASYSNGALVKADGADDSDFANFLKNISSVSVNGTEYAASGRGSVKVIGDDGKIDLTANSRGENVFDGSGSYEIVVTAAGYTKTLEFTFSEDDAQAGSTGSGKESGSNGSGTGSAGTTRTTTTAKNSSSAKTTTTAKNSNATLSPKTGVNGVAVPVAVLAVAATAAIATNKKKRNK